MNRARAVAISSLFAAALSWPGCGGNTATSPSALKETVKVKDATFTVARTSFSRDFMPVVANPGPDGGSALMGSVQVFVRNEGTANRFTVTASVYDADGTRYPMTVVVHDSDGGTGQVDAIWSGSLAAGANRALEVRLTNGPYVSVGARVYAVIEWRGEDGNAGSLRTPDVEVIGTA